ncbi:uncharacterized protein [Arachis hypogaea]|uniref:uncharacterized protein n=1 Tax=Arachis hypogaea TaxID=3818 RepID=UPI003B220D05
MAAMSSEEIRGECGWGCIRCQEGFFTRGFFKVYKGSLSGDSIATVVDKQGDTQTPCVDFTEEAKLCLAEPYREALVIKVLDKNYSYTALSHKLWMIWRIKGGFDLLDVGFGYFMVKFDAGEDRDKVMLGGPWLIEGHYVAVKPWDMNFRPCEQSFGSTLVWVRILRLPIWCYQEQAMMRIASAIGVPIKVDLGTKLAERRRYAQACVQINLGLPVINHIIVEGVTHVME